MTSMSIEMLNSIIAFIISFVALIVSIIALVYTAKTYLLKSGAYIRGSCSTYSSVTCEDKYISNVILENLKDRAIVIFKIYLKLGHNYFVEIDDFENDPLILKPFEVFKKDYQPLDFYSVGTRRVLINDLLDNKFVSRKLVLSTSDGKYPVGERINQWDPLTDFFQNNMTAIIQPIRFTHKGKSYGSKAQFIVEFKMPGGKEKIIPIYPLDYELKKFENLNLTKKALESKEMLEEYLNNQVNEGKLDCEEITVYDLENLRDELYEGENKNSITATYDSWFSYYIVGRISTIFENYRRKRQNKVLHSKKH